MSTSASPLRVAVIGWGNFFEHIHEQTLRDLIDEGRVGLQAVCVRSPDTRAAITARCPAVYDTADAERVLADPEVDAILIGAPQSVQARYALAAVEAGKYVYVEKPLFAEAADTGREPAAFHADFAAREPAASRLCAVGLNKRFAPAYVELRERCRTQWGGVRHLQLTVVDDAWRWGARYPDGFLLWLDLCHWLDLARWFTDAEVDRLSCLEPQPNDAQVTLVMSDGAVVSILLSGNGTMDMCKEELRVITAGRRCATVSDFVEMEVFGGDEPEVRNWPANRQTGGDEQTACTIDTGGLTAFRAVRRAVFDRFSATRQSDPAGDEQVRRNIPNFMRPQGWNASVRAFVTAASAGEGLQQAASYHDAYIAYRLLDTVRASIAADGRFVTVPPLV
ncbi:MAG: Gfo/Idh/MocA family protein [Planctomycetota bacterium]